MSSPLTVRIDSTVIVTRPDGSRAVSVYQGPDFLGFSDAQASEDQLQSNFDIPAGQSVSLAIPPNSSNAKFLFYRFSKAVTLSGLIAAANTRYGVIEITSANPLTILAGAEDTSGFAMILGA